MYAEAIDKYVMNEPKAQQVAIDWQGGDVYKGDTIRFIDGEIVLEDDVTDFLDARWGKVQTA